MVKSGQALAGAFVTRDATGALAAATVGPAGTLYIDGVADAATVTITGSNPYKWAVTLPALAAGQLVQIYITATIGGAAHAEFVMQDTADTKRVSDLNDAAAAPSAATVASQVRTELTTELARIDTPLSNIETDTQNLQSRTPAALVGGRMDANMGAISDDATAADNLETMLDGTGGSVLSLKQIDINNSDGSPNGQGIDITARQGIRIIASDRGVHVAGGANQALYLASATAASTVYVEGPSDGTGSAIAISSPGSGSGNSDSGEAIWIETQEGHPAIRIAFSAITNGNVLDVDNSNDGSWIWDQFVGMLKSGAITLSVFDQSTAFPLTQADTGGTAIARTGADSDTLETLSDQIDAVGSGGLTAQETRDAMKLAPSAGEPEAGSIDDLIESIQAGSGLTAQQTRDAMKLAPSAGAPAAGSVDDLLVDMPATILATAIAAYAGTPGTVGYLLSLLAGLDFTAVNLVATSNAGEITIKRTLNLAAVVSGLTIPADWVACYWTVKRSTDDLDADAIVQVLVSNPSDPDDGVQVLMGTALEDESDGSLVVNQALGTVTIALGDASTALLEDAVELVWDIKVHTATGKTQPGAGTATITTAVTRA